jgi:hypothetical protein
MSKTLELILNEMYDGNTISPEYTKDYIRKFLRPIEYSPLDSVPLDSEENSYETTAEEFHAELHKFIHSGDDELTITYESGQSITLEDEIVKLLVAKASTQELEMASVSSTYMHDLLVRVCDGVMDTDEYDEAEETIHESKDDPCWNGYKQLGTKDKNGKKVPNCVKEDIACKIETLLTEIIQEIREQESDFAITEQRFKIVNRVRGGKVQRRRKVSTTPGYRFQDGRLVRISAREKLNRKRGQRRGSIKRKAKLSGALRRRKISIRKRGTLGN